MKSINDKDVVALIRAFRKSTDVQVLQVDVDECGVVIYWKQRKELFKVGRYGHTEFPFYDIDQGKCS